MLSQNNVRSITGKTGQVFNVIEEFAALSSQRKLSLCNCLFSQDRGAFENAVKLLWPAAQPIDMKKLEKFLLLLRKTAH